MRPNVKKVEAFSKLMLSLLRRTNERGNPPFGLRIGDCFAIARNGGALLRWLIAVFVLAIQLMACNGRLSDEQKRKIKEEMESSQIVKIPEATITEAAFQYGRTIIAPLEARDQQLMNQKLIDSLQEAFHVSIKALTANDSLLREVEKKMIEAYLGAGSEQLTDNVQKMGADSIFYTKPFMKTNPDGSSELIKVVGIRMSKREVIKQIKK